MPSDNPLLLYLLARDELNAEERGIVEEMASGSTKRVEAGEDLIKEGSMPTASQVMIDGYSARYHLLADGRRNISALHIPGDFVDLHSLLLRPMDHSVVAISDCSVASVPHALLRRLSETHSHLSRLLWLSTLIDAAMHRRWLVAAGRLSAIGRIAHLLCELWVRLQTARGTNGYRFWLPLSQAQLSDAMGLSTVHINRTLQQMRRRGLIRWQGSDVEILDWEALREVGQFEQDYLNLVPMAR
jgi:CRP-like cAMP-binding protein